MGKSSYRIEYKRKDFNMDEGVDVPTIMTHHTINGQELLIAPEKATWITTSRVGKMVIDQFRMGKTIRQVVHQLQDDGHKLQTIESELRQLFVALEQKGFFQSISIKEQEPEISLQLFLTNQCNLNCIHCYMDAGISYNNELSTEEFISVVDNFAKFHQTKVVFSGGEPLLHPGFFDIANRCKEHGMLVHLLTNGTLISEDMIDKFERCVDEIQLSLDGATPEVNDQIRGEGVFRRVVHAIEMLRDSNIKQRVAILLMPLNYNDFLNNVESFSKVLGDAELRFSFANTEGRADETMRFNSISDSEKKLQKILKILYQKKLNVMNRFEPNLKVVNCGYGETIAISSNGDIFPCAVLKYKAGNIRKSNFSDVLQKIKHKLDETSVENLEPCVPCDLKYICFGGCRHNNIKYHDDILKPYCPKGKKEDIYNRLVARDNFNPLSLWLNEDGVQN